MIDVRRLARGIYWERAWSLVERCTRVSDGCKNCWAQAGHDRWKRSDKVTPRPDRLEQPLRRRKPTVYAIWDDLFHDAVPFEFIRGAFAVMSLAERHRFIVLTKRSKRARIVLENIHFKDCAWPLPNVILGTSVETCDYGWRIDELLACPAACRMLSLEPLLGPVDLDGRSDPRRPGVQHWDYLNKETGHVHTVPNWVVVGAETGPHRRPCKLAHVESIAGQCRDAGVPCYVKALDIDGKLVVSMDDPRWPTWAPRELPGLIEVT